MAISAADVIGPAFNRTKQFLFRPFRMPFWLRVTFLGLATGEMSAGGGCNFNFPAEWHKDRGSQDFAAAHFAGNLPFDPAKLMALLPLIILFFIVFYLVWMYVSSMSRFILFETILTGEAHIRDGWTRWSKQGISFFRFQLLLLCILLGVFFFVVVGFVVLAAIAGIHRGASPGSAVAAVLLVFLALLVFIPIMLAFIIVHVLVKDFAVPIMALENVPISTAWPRMWAMIGKEKGSFAGYIGLKIALTIGAAFYMGIVGFIVLLVVLLPVGGVGFVAVLAGKTAGLTWNVGTIALAAAGLTVVVAIVLFVLGFVGSPVTIFFPSYATLYFAGRYQPLHDALYPPAPPNPPVEPTPETGPGSPPAPEAAPTEPAGPEPPSVPPEGETPK